MRPERRTQAFTGREWAAGLATSNTSLRSVRGFTPNQGLQHG